MRVLRSSLRPPKSAMHHHCHGLLVAAGRSQRFGRDKLSLRLSDGHTVLHHAARSLISAGIKDLIIVGNPGPEHRLDVLLDGRIQQVPGGAQRVDSVRNGLMALPAQARLVAVHDGARPFCSPGLVVQLVAAAAEGGAAVPVLESPDSLLVLGESGEPVRSLRRQQVRRVQTPQVARRDWLEEALLAGGDGATDESSALLAAGYPVQAVPGEETNIKITHPSDLPQPPRRTVVGQGFDVHRYDADRELVLGGCILEGEPGLAGHSDADVLLHALVDAVLGALGAGDIGEHFPPDEPRWAGADSTVFLCRALELLEEAGGQLEHVDLCLIGEQPRLKPHKARIRTHLADLLGLPMGAINLKATTTEGLGFTGRREGLAVQALATVTLPPPEGDPG